MNILKNTNYSARIAYDVQINGNKVTAEYLDKTFCVYDADDLLRDWFRLTAHDFYTRYGFAINPRDFKSFNDIFKEMEEKVKNENSVFRPR